MIGMKDKKIRNLWNEFQTQNSVERQLKYFRANWMGLISICNDVFLMILRGDLACSIALNAVRTVLKDENGRREIDIKRYAKVEKVFLFLWCCTYRRFCGVSVSKFQFLSIGQYFYECIMLISS